MKSEWLVLRVLLDLKLRDALGALRGMTSGRILRLTVSLALAIGVSVLVYFFDLYVFNYLMGVPDLGKLVLARFFELAFLFFFAVLVVSTALTALSMMYREDELSLLFSLPVSQATLFTVKYLEVILYSSWALVALSVPFVLSYGIYFEVNWAAYFSLFAGLLLPLVLISGSLGVAGAVFLRWLLGRIPRRKLLTGMIIAATLALMIAVPVTLSRPQVGKRGLDYLFTLIEEKPNEGATLIPHELIARGFFSILENRYDLLEQVILTLLGMSALIVLLTLDMGRVLYYKSYLAGGDSPVALPARRRPTGLLRRVPKPSAWLSPVYRALLRKDFLELRRYPLQWGQIVLLLGFWALYLINMLNVKRFFDVSGDFWKMLLYYANFSFACYFAAAVAGRFIFPLISLEGRAIWVLRSSPLAMDSLIWAKFWQAFPPLFLLAGSLVLAGDLILGVHPALLQVSLCAILVTTFALAALTLGLGGVFADFSQRNPMKIANTPGGILCIFLSLLFTLMVTTVFAWPTYLHYRALTMQGVFPLSEWNSATILIIALGIVASLIPLKLGLRALNADLKA